MSLNKLLRLGNPQLYEISIPFEKSELPFIKTVVEELNEVIIAFRGKYGAGRAIAAPQIGVKKRLIYMLIDTPLVFINPVLSDLSDNMFEIWDDCMCFPELLVKVKRHKSCKISFYNLNWERHTMSLTGDLSELFQHEYDHLDGILATQKAIDNRAFMLREVYMNRK